jgi:uncharacterized membrane protein YraQ (UPF0718 family)
VVVAIIAAVAAVVVAVIGGPVMYWLSSFKKQNTEEHEINKALNLANAETLARIETKVDQAGEHIVKHLEWHFNPTPPTAPAQVVELHRQDAA